MMASPAATSAKEARAAKRAPSKGVSIGPPPKAGKGCCGICDVAMLKAAMQSARTFKDITVCEKCAVFVEAKDVPHTIESMLKEKKTKSHEQNIADRDEWHLNQGPDAVLGFMPESVFEEHYTIYETVEHVKFRPNEVLKPKFGTSTGVSDSKMEALRITNRNGDQVLGVLMVDATKHVDFTKDLDLTARTGTRFVKTQMRLDGSRHFYPDQANQIVNKCLKTNSPYWGQANAKRYKSKIPKPIKIYTEDSLDAAIEEEKRARKREPQGHLQRMAAGGDADEESSLPCDEEEEDGDDAAAEKVAAPEPTAAAPSPEAARRASALQEVATPSAGAPSPVLARSSSGLGVAAVRPPSLTASMLEAHERRFPQTSAARSTKCAVSHVGTAVGAEEKAARVRQPSHWIDMFSEDAAFAGSVFTRERAWACDCADRVEPKDPCKVAMIRIVIKYML